MSSEVSSAEKGQGASGPPLRFGTLGAARITPVALLRPARSNPDVDVVAVAARDPTRARAFAFRHGIRRVHPSYADLLRDPELDAVYNPLPNSLHCEWTIRALEAGKHVLCEKPLASNAEEAERMAGVAEKTGLVLMEAFHYRYHPLARRLRELVDSGELGRVRHIEAHLCIPLLRPGDIRYDFALAGGALMDVGCYAVNLVRYLAGEEPAVEEARALRLSPEIDRFLEARLSFPGGLTGRITCSLLSARAIRASARVEGTEGELRVLNPYAPHLFHWVRIRTRRRSAIERVHGSSTYAHQLRAFVSAVRDGTPFPTTARDGVANMRVLDAIYEKAGMARRGGAVLAGKE
ncbi:MAG: oxidoreductase [Candidatus Binatia bacterium]|nr:MAG: oxidoreductase [Candidatus Binatia bacterium]